MAFSNFYQLLLFYFQRFILVKAIILLLHFCVLSYTAIHIYCYIFISLYTYYYIIILL